MIGAAFMSAGNIIRFGLQLVMLPILGRMLGPHGYGLASFAMPLISLASLVSDTGLSNAVASGGEMSVRIEFNIYARGADDITARRARPFSPACRIAAADHPWRCRLVRICRTVRPTRHLQPPGRL